MGRPRVTAGRGRPVTFDEPAQAEFLRLVASGVRIGEAADKLGVSRRTPTQLKTRDRGFAERLAAAKTAGSVARIPHGTPGGYNNHGCRRPCCRAEATAARAAHRDTTRDDRTAQVHPLPVVQPRTATTKFSVLADVS
ncbi:helix-turn-helix domain-containing protein [Streptomyces platensis]|uniref:helix-turn-helix domain-containing protein n=1 Tax=Streptomyces platensis TaxID=58346 RepID=UPI0036A37FBB